MIKSVITRDGKGTADTMLISSHLSQMKMFGIRQGVEYYPMQDNLGTQRFDFVQQVIKFNQLDARLDAISLANSSLLACSANFLTVGRTMFCASLKASASFTVLSLLPAS